jgi:D-beta-D-heptose 7-phosphate kinase/D-beta-D-heptose 1-phosphate adenosyltransferase
MPINNTKRRALHILSGTSTFEERFAPNHDELVELIEELRSSGAIIVFTAGVWDLFHVGHGDYIQKGKEEAKKLYPEAEHIVMVVAVDTDELTRERKGPKRPIVPEDERYRVLGHLRHVDIIAPERKFGELQMIVKHDVRVISTSTKDLPANRAEFQALCTYLVDLPPQAKTSTTSRIRGLAIDGGLETFNKINERLTQAWDTFQQAMKEVGDELSQ